MSTASAVAGPAPTGSAPTGSQRSGSSLLDAAWEVHPQVAIRPERFGALLYHFGTRRLSFVKSPLLHTVVASLSEHPTARAACLAAGVDDAELPTYAASLRTLAATSMIRPSTR